MGDLYYLDQQHHAALDTWCRGLWVGYSDALAERVLAVARETADIWAAITLIHDCLTCHLQDGRYYFLLSKLLRRAGEEEESMASLAQATYWTPELLAAREELGDEYSRVGQADKAAMTYRDGLRIARAQETVYRCQVCGYITKEEQVRCFQCNRWVTLAKMTRGEAEVRLPAPRNLFQRASVVRQSLASTWGKLTGRLLPGG